MYKSIVEPVIRYMVLLIAPAFLFLCAMNVKNNILGAALIFCGGLLAVLTTRYYKWKCLQENILFVSETRKDDFAMHAKDPLYTLNADELDCARSIFDEYKVDLQKTYASEPNMAVPSYLKSKAFFDKDTFLAETLFDFMDDMIKKNKYTILQISEDCHKYTMAPYGRAAYSIYLYAASHREFKNNDTITYIENLLDSKIITEDEYGQLFGEEVADRK